MWYFIGKCFDIGDKEKCMWYLFGKCFVFDGNVNKWLCYFFGKCDFLDIKKRIRYFIEKWFDEYGSYDLE